MGGRGASAQAHVCVVCSKRTNGAGRAGRHNAGTRPNTNLNGVIWGAHKCSPLHHPINGNWKQSRGNNGIPGRHGPRAT